MSAKIEELIEGQDAVEQVRDQIAALIVLELANQQVLATAAGKDPNLWKLHVFTERADPWNVWFDEPEQFEPPGQPVVSVWFERDSVSLDGSNLIRFQKMSGTFNLDCYGYGVNTETDDGHQSADEAAAMEAQRAARLVRRILMAGTYTYLGMRDIVSRRYVEGRHELQPTLEDIPAVRVIGLRMKLRVDYEETSPQVQGQVVSDMRLTVKKASNGAVIFDATYPQV